MELLSSVTCLTDILEYKKLGLTGVIVSCDYFATRQSHYFTKEDIACSMKEHADISYYTNINRIFAENELSLLKNHLQWCKDMNFAGIYYSDPAVYVVAKQLGIEEKLIYNQDTVLTNSLDIQSYLDLGIKRCVISREITLEEILHIMNRCDKRLELMVHGHMNLSYSKRRLVSCYFDEINKEYDTSAIYTLEEETRKDKMFIIQDEQGTHVFTGTRLQMVCEVSKLLDLDAIRIDTIFMNSDEIKEAISYYHQLIHGADSNLIYQDWILSNESLYTSGYLYQKTNISK